MHRSTRGPTTSPPATPYDVPHDRPATHFRLAAAGADAGRPDGRVRRRLPAHAVRDARLLPVAVRGLGRVRRGPADAPRRLPAHARRVLPVGRGPVLRLPRPAELRLLRVSRDVRS